MTEPTLTKHLNSLTYSWPSVSIDVSLSRVKESGGEMKAELTAMNGKGILTQQSINLLAGRSRGMLAKELQGKHQLSSPSWETILEAVCVKGLRELRKGEPTIVLQPHEQPNVPFLLNPLIYQKHQTLMYAPGGSCKSFLALYLALLACHGAQQNGLAALPCPVLYLDYELDAETIGTRLNRLYKGHPELSQFAPYYRACNQPLHEEVDTISAEVDEKGIKLVIVDSAIMACGDDMQSTMAPKMIQRALRQLRCASLVLTHVAKNTEQKTAYGSVFFQNLCRNQYAIEVVETNDDETRITLEHTKHNFGRKQPLAALSFSFANDACRVSTFDPFADEGTDEAVLPLAARIRNLLEDGMARSAREIAEALHEKLETAKVTLSKHAGVKWFRIGTYHSGQWTVLNPKK